MRVDGAEYRLAPRTVLSESFAPIVDYIAAARKGGDLTQDIVLNLSKAKIRHYSPEALINILLASLTSEPTSLIIALSKAAEFFDDKAKAPAKPKPVRRNIWASGREASLSLVAALLTRETASRVAALTGLTLPDVLTFEASHV